MPPVSHIYSPPFVSPKAYTLNNIPCDGEIHSLVAAFSDSTNCVDTITYQAPQTECPAAVISGGGLVCNNGINTGTVDINITGGVPPFSFTWAIDGLSQLLY